MKALRLHEYRTPPQLDDVPEPEIRDPHDVIVRVGGAGVCRTDLHLIEGELDEIYPAARPFALGHENAGWVEAVGPAVKNVRVGDAVILHPLRTCGLCEACRLAEDMYCADFELPGLNVDGGYAEYLRTSDRTPIVLPEGLAPAEAAPHADAGLTSYHAVRKAAASLVPGDTVAVIGIGGLGHVAVQLLRELTAARIVAIDRSAAARAVAGEAGADEVLDADGAAEAVVALTSGRGANVVLDFVGEHGTPRQGVEMIAQRGLYVTVGYGGDLEVTTLELVWKEIRVHGSQGGTYAELSQLMSLVGRGRLKLHTTPYPLESAVQALDDLRHGRVQGRAVITPNAR